MRAIPLTPADGSGLCISDLAMAAADIVVSTTDALISGIIRADTGSPISHAAIYDGAGGVYEAIGAGVIHHSLHMAIADDTLAVTYRLKSMNTAAARKILSFAQSVVGRPYDTRGAIGGGMRYNSMVCIAAVGIVPCSFASMGVFKSEDKFYCSQLVLEAYRRAGVSLIDVNPNVSVPQDIVNAYSSHKLMYVGHLFSQEALRATVGT